MYGNHRFLSFSSLALAAGSLVALSSVASAGPDDSVWYQPPQRAAQPAQPVRASKPVVRVSSHSRHSHSGYSSSYRYDRSYSSSCYPYSYSRTYRSYPRYDHAPNYRSYSRPTVISVPSSSTRITYVTPVVQETRYLSSQPSGAYGGVSYAEYQRVLAEQRVLRQQILDQQREQEAAKQPTYNPGPPVPSTAPLSVAKQSPGSEVKPDRPRSADEILPPVPRESSVQTQVQSEAATAALTPEWEALASGNYAYAMRLFSDLAGEETASTADRIGFALAAAGTGQRERAAWAMRRVLVADSAGFGFIPASDELRASIKRLGADITRDADARPDGPDRRMLMFLTATMDYLALDMESGIEHLDQAKVDGADHHEAAQQLRELLTESGATGF
ncbi:MAG: hypothetical protein ACF8MJ_02480 [Phycisphaerales bacterium JB050]